MLWMLVAQGEVNPEGEPLEKVAADIRALLRASGHKAIDVIYSSGPCVVSMDQGELFAMSPMQGAVLAPEIDEPIVFDQGVPSPVDLDAARQRGEEVARELWPDAVEGDREGWDPNANM